ARIRRRDGRIRRSELGHEYFLQRQAEQHQAEQHQDGACACGAAELAWRTD
ncbi:hypothetical protein A2U01_0076532, partial [Trifolium medium]|nr:hypothetical protein [Trifolium medium]